MNHVLTSLPIAVAIIASSNEVLSAPLTDLSLGQTGYVEFNSITSPHRNAYARLNLDTTKTVTISAELIMPKGAAAGIKVPAVILSHGSGGVESNLYDVWAKELSAAGYAVFIPDSYKLRGVAETNSNQEAVPYPAHIADTLFALRLLATHPGIDAQRIYNMGFSRGGTSAFDVAWPSWQRPVNTNGVKFAGHIAWYPGNCDVRYRTDDREVPTAPIFVLLADRENEEAQDVAVCRRYFDDLVSCPADT